MIEFDLRGPKKPKMLCQVAAVSLNETSQKNNQGIMVLLSIGF